MKKANTASEYGQLRELSIGHYAELLIAEFAQSSMAQQNNAGFDVLSDQYGKIEVRSRTIGTDGYNPRLSITENRIVLGSSHF